MQRVTDKDLQAIVNRLNRMLNQPVQPYTKTDSGFKVNIGNFHLSHAYGGVCLHRMVNDGGGVTDVLYCGHVPKRELQTAMFAFIKGLEIAQS